MKKIQIQRYVSLSGFAVTKMIYRPNKKIIENPNDSCFLE